MNERAAHSAMADRSTSQSMHSDADVLIVGAGPCGQTLALLLAKRGRTVTLYERWPAAYPLPRAAAMSHETVRTFQSAGVLERLRPYLALDNKKVSASMYAADGEVLSVMTFPGLGESGYPPMVGFHQPDVDQLLGEMCVAHPLITLHRGWEAQAFEQTNEGVIVTLKPVDGEQPREGQPIKARGKFLVGCDGANSLIRSLMKTEVTDTGFSASWLVIDTFPKPGVPPISYFGHVLDPARPATLAPAGKDRQRYEFMLIDGDDPAQITSEASVWPLLARWDVTPEKVQLARSAVFTFRGRWAESWRDGRVLLAGDAAHQMPPFMGQGFNSGVRDTIALAWRLDLILAGKAAPELLDSYTTERLYHVKQIVESSVAIGQMTCTTDPVAAAERDASLRMIRDTPDMPAFPQPEWRLGPGCFMPDDPASGFIAYQARVEKDGKSGLLEDLADAGNFVLYGYGVDPSASLSDSAKAIWRELGGRSIIIGAAGYRDVDGIYAGWFETLAAKVILVRPDFQVFGASANPAHANEMIDTLAAKVHLRSVDAV